MRLLSASLLAALVLAFAAPTPACARDGGLIIYDTSGSMMWNGQALAFGGLIQQLLSPPAPTGGRVAATRHGTSTAAEVAGGGGEPRIMHARRVATEVLERFQRDNLLAGLMVFGQGGCDAIEVAHQLGTPIGVIESTVAGLQPMGNTPIAASLLKAAEYIKTSGMKVKEVVLITDGYESCMGNPTAAAAKLHAETGAKLKIIGLDTQGLEAHLRDVAAAGGGDYEGIAAVGAGGDKVEAGGGKNVTYDTSKPDPAKAPPPMLLMPPPINGLLPSQQGTGQRN
ncbi:MAG: hypothetical protein HY075_13595 [Deltaproteobacteria bacterium]|nr:hypothetical protein [Deltaproteobacteria bacterium]